MTSFFLALALSGISLTKLNQCHVNKDSEKEYQQSQDAGGKSASPVLLFISALPVCQGDDSEKRNENTGY